MTAGVKAFTPALQPNIIQKLQALPEENRGKPLQPNTLQKIQRKKEEEKTNQNKEDAAVEPPLAIKSEKSSSSSDSTSTDQGLKIEGASGEVLQQDPTTENYYTVQPGETLQVIANKFQVNAERLTEANSAKIKTWGQVKGFNAGEKIKIPEANVSQTTPTSLPGPFNSNYKPVAVPDPGKKDFTPFLISDHYKSSSKSTNIKQQVDTNTIAAKIFKAVDGLGTDEDAIFQALSGLNKNQSLIDQLKRQYASSYGESLEDALRGDLGSDDLKKALAYLNMHLSNTAKNTENGETQIKAKSAGFSPSYIGKTFIVNNDDCRVRNAQLVEEKDAKGNFNKIPKGTKIEITDSQVINSKGYIYAKNYGWISRTNVEGGMVNETLGVSKAKYDSTNPNHKTVGSADARLRNGGSKYDEIKGRKISQGDYVIVKEESQDTVPKGKYVKVSAVSKDKDGKFSEGQMLGWTSKTNLVDGWAPYKAYTAEWEKGNYIGQTDVAHIVGTQGIEQISTKTLEQFYILQKAAAKDGLDLRINDGFRQYSKQKELWNANPNTEEVAKPGKSNHQHGQALDLNTGGFNTQIYNWLKNNGPKYGWLRTVRKEHWHWEYRPEDAKKYGFKLPNIDI